MQKARCLEVSMQFFILVGEPDRRRLKQLLSAGEHDLDGAMYRVIRDPIPDDAVLAVPEPDHLRQTLKFSVLSDEFADADPTWITPICEHITDRPRLPWP